MAQAAKYQVKAQLYQQGPVTAFQGLDPLTGLPVRLYRFTGKPTSQVDRLESDYIPTILATGFNGQEGTLATTFHKDLKAIHQVSSEAEASILIEETAQALHDAALAGVIHGDLEPKRFFKAGHFVIEGYGVPWQEAHQDYRPPDVEGLGSYEGDVYAWAMSLKVLAKGFVPERFQALLESCLATDPKLRPSAREILSLIEQAKQHGNAGVSAAVQSGDVEFGDIDFSVQSPPPTPASPPMTVKQGPPPSVSLTPPATKAEETAASPPASPAPKPVTKPVQKGPPPRTIQHHLPKDQALPDDSFDDDLMMSKETQGDFVKAAPPGATYRTVEESNLPAPKLELNAEPTATDKPERNNRTRRTLMLLALFIAAGALASTVLFFGNNNNGTPGNANDGLQVLEINLNPSNLPFVELIVISSPPGSARQPGDVVATLTPGARNVILDQAGTWSLRAKYQERYSELISVRVPEQKTINVFIPE